MTTKLKINPDGEVWREDEAPLVDTIQQAVGVYCDEWLKCDKKHMGLPLAKILRECAGTIESRLK